MSTSQTGGKGGGEDASTPMLPGGGAGGAGQAHVIRMDSSTANLQSSVSARNFDCKPWTVDGGEVISLAVLMAVCLSPCFSVHLHGTSDVVRCAVHAYVPVCVN